MNKIIIKITSTILIAVISVFIFSIFIQPSSHANIAQTQHENCFTVEQGCGPMQHLLHNYKLEDNTKIKKITYYYTLLADKLNQETIFIKPETPPPPINNINQYG